ncbi:SGNH/GDSL hydrolase family protein [Patulibacter sp.]|uniref:SGNH/GDSL hydrolase family protein n=1 Tax=Patulibacter sp. TaxID=1912859 RepID=UPI0027170685|nr:SGNH/GDSL hydrolase family protein [Patulibacter sp.]MDO9409186.1 SGNH/GDSL hydrolase family protein [Patulibacter sp.]
MRLPLIAARRARHRWSLLAAVAALALAGCGGSPSADALQVVSLGDSLAVGVQPKLLGGGQETSQGYPRRFARALRDEGREVRLIELGCGGATSQSILVGIRPCAPARDTPYRNEDPTTSQASWAEGLLSSTKGRRRVVLLDIGGNDVGSCFSGGRVLPGCIARAGAALRENLGELLGRLREVDRTVPIGVLTLYDPLLGLWDDQPAARPLLAREHRTFLRAVNGTIAAAARRYGATLVDLAGAMDQSAPLDPGSSIRPRAVAAICRYTWMCVSAPRTPDIHLRKDGYELAGRTALSALRPRLGAPR